MSAETVARAVEIIRHNRYLTLSTFSIGTGVWSTPLAYSVDEKLRFHFYSEVSSRHCRQIGRGAKVAFSIYNSSLPSADVDGIQLAAVCAPLKDRELETVYEYYFRQSFPDPDERRKWQKPIERFRGASRQKFYELTVDEIHIIDLDFTDADRRTQVPVRDVVQSMR